MNIDKPASLWREPEVLFSVATLLIVAIVCVAFQYVNLNRQDAIDAKTAAITASMQVDSKITPVSAEADRD